MTRLPEPDIDAGIIALEPFRPQRHEVRQRVGANIDKLPDMPVTVSYSASSTVSSDAPLAAAVVCSATGAIATASLH